MTEGRREDGARAETGRRLSVAEAASELGTTSEGVRSRIKRGTLQAERESGRVWVILEGAPPRPGAAPPQPDAAPPGDRAGDRTELVDELRARVSSLERQLDLERDANRENRRLLAAALERIPPQLEAPREAPEASETVEEETERAEAQATTPPEQAQRPTEGVEHDASTLREWTGDVEARRSDAGEAQEGV